MYIGGQNHEESMKGVHLLTIGWILTMMLRTDVVLGQMDQYVHAELLHADTLYEITLLGDSTTSAESYISWGSIDPKATGLDWLVLEEAAQDDYYVLEFMVDESNSMRMSLGLKDSTSTASCRIEIDQGQAHLNQNGTTLYSFPHDSEHIYKIVQCEGIIAYLVNNVEITQVNSQFTSAVRATLDCQSAQNERAFIHYLIDDQCEADQDILYYVPSVKFSNDPVTIEGDLLGLYYLQKYHISSVDSPLHDNNEVSITITEASAPNQEVLGPITLENRYGKNQLTVDVSSLSSNQLYTLRMEGANKETTYYLTFSIAP